MTKQFEVYKCAHCGNIVEVVHGGGASLVCCGEKMKLLAEGTSDGAKEKHVPVLENRGSYILLNPGSVSLPKQNTAKSYMIYENGVFTLKDLDGNKLNSLSVS